MKLWNQAYAVEKRFHHRSPTVARWTVGSQLHQRLTFPRKREAAAFLTSFEAARELSPHAEVWTDGPCDNECGHKFDAEGGANSVGFVFDGDWGTRHDVAVFCTDCRSHGPKHLEDS